MAPDDITIRFSITVGALHRRRMFAEIAAICFENDMACEHTDVRSLLETTRHYRITGHPVKVKAIHVAVTNTIARINA